MSEMFLNGKFHISHKFNTQHSTFHIKLNTQLSTLNTKKSGFHQVFILPHLTFKNNSVILVYGTNSYYIARE